MKNAMLITIMALVTAFTLQARERFPIQFDGQQFRGENTLFLKRELRQEHGIRAQNFNLKKVVLVAKSKRGRGTAYLQVGGHSSYDQTIDGRPNDFHTEDRDTYFRTVFRNTFNNSNGVWQIHMRGNIKVKRVVLVLERKRVTPPRPGRLTFQSMGLQRFNKVIEDRETYSVGKRGVRALRITAKDNSVQVNSVTVKYSNGDREDAYLLEGYLAKNNNRTMHIDSYGRRIQSVTIVGVSGLFGSRGKIELEVGIR